MQLEKTLDGAPVPDIHDNLASGIDVTKAYKLLENRHLAFEGVKKYGPFEIDKKVADWMLAAPINPNGRPNSDVIRPWFNGDDLTERPHGRFIIDFGKDTSSSDACLFELPFEYIRTLVLPARLKKEHENLDGKLTKLWWLHERWRPALRKSLAGLSRYIATPRVGKHRIFSWVVPDAIPDTRVISVARDDDYFFGVLHSSAHELWSWSTASRHGVGNDPTYNSASCFETIPFPWPPGTEPTEAQDPRVQTIAEAARNLVQLRDAWLNPPDTPEAELKKHTLTNLYNQRPTWLADAHRTLDAAVFAAYGWPATLTTQEILANLLALNHQRAAAPASPAN
jgi:type II restriction/modification system DNA methylase subunit YeeA